MRIRNRVALGICLIFVVIAFDFHAAKAAPNEAERLRSLEPQKAVDIDEEAYSPELPVGRLSPAEILRSGSGLPIRMLLDKPEWRRQVYKSYWHSTFLRWSYVPRRVHYAQHRIFVTLPAALSEWYDFTHELGIAEEMAGISTEEAGASQADRLGRIAVVVMQAKVERVVSLGNQVIIKASPRRSGLQVFTVNRRQMKLDRPERPILFQLVSRDGEEWDAAAFVQ